MLKLETAQQKSVLSSCTGDRTNVSDLKCGSFGTNAALSSAEWSQNKVHRDLRVTELSTEQEEPSVTLLCPLTGA